VGYRPIISMDAEQFVGPASYPSPILTQEAKRRMSLETYRKKRDFRLTPEPEGKARRPRKDGLAFVIQKHEASRLHYDFRLELEGALKSWAVPKGPSLDPTKKSLAVQVEDHPLDYGEFEGVIPKGQYGGGTVLLWDRGVWTPLNDPVEGHRSGKLHFRLEGQKLRGEWTLVRMHGASGDGGKNWLLIKSRDQFADPTRNIVEEARSSVRSGRTLDRIRDARDEVWSPEAQATARLERARRSAMPTALSPQLAVLADRPPEGDEWLHEVKYDGYRLVAFISNGKVRLRTRRGNDWTERFSAVAEALSQLKVDSAVIDGEVVVFDKSGRSDFQSLQAMLKDGARASPVFVAFDLPYCDGMDIRSARLDERKKRLDEILRRSGPGPRILYSDHIRGHGGRAVERACRMGLEGIISKRADAPYVSRREPTWLKSKCVQRQEFVIVGYTDPRGGRSVLGALLLAVHDDRGRLVYAGRVGTGFGESTLRDLRARLEAIPTDGPPAGLSPTPRAGRGSHWVEPTLVAEVRFTEWTRDGVLRNPTFIALRSDKPVSKIVRERPIKPEATSRSRRSVARRDGPSGPFSASARPEPSAVAGVRLTHPEKVMYPSPKITKREIAEYYVAVQKWMLPFVAGRPLTLLRCPDGVSGKCFYQRNWNSTMPPAIGKVRVGGPEKQEEHVILYDARGLVALVQMGVLEIHCWNGTATDVEHPDQLIFDLDPGDGVPWKRIVEGARALKKLLDSLGLPSFIKTSGGKGFHVVVPIQPNIDWESAKSFTKTIAEDLSRGSDIFVANMRKELRRGKIYIDYNRNDHFATAVAPYSARSRAGAPVSMPIPWRELSRLESADQYDLHNAVRYCARRSADPWRDFERSRVNLRSLVRSKDWGRTARVGSRPDRRFPADGPLPRAPA
jgi:bifunctional non-homologous end joining protein LigD